MMVEVGAKVEQEPLQLMVPKLAKAELKKPSGNIFCG